MSTSKSNTPKSGTTESGAAESGATFTGDIPADAKTVAGEGAAGGPSLKSVPPQDTDSVKEAEASTAKWHQTTRWRVGLGVVAATILGAVGYKTVRVVQARRAAKVTVLQPGTPEHMRLEEAIKGSPITVPNHLMHQYTEAVSAPIPSPLA